MKFLLKIVQGPNAGAEIALVEGVRVTLGSADSCDIVLADPTLAAEACAVEATADAVLLTVPGAEPERLDPLRVRSFGSTALAVGPADSPWGPLNWEAPAAEPPAGAGEARPESAPAASDTDSGTSGPSSAPNPDVARPADSGDKPRSRKRGLVRGCLVALLVLLLLLAAAVWFLLPHRRPANPEGPAPSGPAPAESAPSGLAAIAARLGLDYFPTNNPPLVRGDFATRAERFAATAELYEAQPGIALDLADRETLLTAASDLLQAATDGTLTVSDVTNRVAVLGGHAADPAALASALESLRTDVPRLSGADTAAVKLDSLYAAPAAPGGAGRATRPSQAQRPRIPLRCILLQPYPCLVLQDGQRLFEGAAVGDYKISKIAFDRITFRRGEEEELEWTP